MSADAPVIVAAMEATLPAAWVQRVAALAQERLPYRWLMHLWYDAAAVERVEIETDLCEMLFDRPGTLPLIQPWPCPCGYVIAAVPESARLGRFAACPGCAAVYVGEGARFSPWLRGPYRRLCLRCPGETVSAQRMEASHMKRTDAD